MIQQPHQQQQRIAFPQPPKLNRPASVLLEPSTSYQHETTTRPRSQSQVTYSSYVPPPSINSPTTLSINNNSTNNSISGLEPSSDIQPRLQNWRPPTNKSKLSKQYTPSEEDSDDEATRGDKNTTSRRSKYMSGAALELNTGPRNQESRVSLGKRISSFFRGSNTKSSNSAPVSSLTLSLSNAAAVVADDSDNPRSATPSLPPIDELTPPDRIHSVYIHQRSHSTPDHVGSITFNQQGIPTTPTRSQSPMITEENRLRTTRDSGFEEVNGKGHRRHSSSIANGRPKIVQASSSPQLQPYQPTPENRRASHLTINKSENLHPDSQQQHRRPSTHLQLSTSSPQLPSQIDNELQLPSAQRHNNRHSFMGVTDMNHYAAQGSNIPKRSNTPIGPGISSSGDTLISKVDREKASVCFQAPSAKKETYTRDANLDPALSSLVQQHRKDFMTNQRLGGTPQLAPQPHSPQFPRQRGSSFHGDDSHHQYQYQHQQQHHQIFPPPMLTAGARRDSGGSMTLGYPSGYSSSSSPSLHPADTQMKRLSISSQYQQHSNYPNTVNATKLSGGQGNLSLQQQQQHYDPSLQISPLVGPTKTSPKRLSSASHFTSHQQPQQQQHQTLQISPFSSPNLGGLPTAANSSTGGSTFLPDAALQQSTQQLEQLQQIRLQQQQVLFQQQQQLQQQIQQTRVAVAVSAAALQQQQQQQQLAQVGLGLGLGLGPIPGAVSPLATTSAALQTPHIYLMHPHHQQQQQLLNATNVQVPVVPMQAYPAGAGHW
ncbi:hypothetical protein FBU30_003240 [Linnemannia zychae]|nr:hypothetical protein FBU30_003240 [Linnemannia zychae]